MNTDMKNAAIVADELSSALKRCKERDVPAADVIPIMLDVLMGNIARQTNDEYVTAVIETLIETYLPKKKVH